MKKIWLLLPVLFALALSATHVEAKKFGGGKSFGKMFQTKPAPAKKAPAKNQDSAQQKQSSKGGLGKGLLGGLLAGGLIAALMGGAFEGIQIMDIILMAVIAFVLLRLFKAMMQSKQSAMEPQAAYAGQQFRQANDSGQNSDPATTNIFGQPVGNSASSLNNTPSQADAGFDEEQNKGFGTAESIPFNLPQGFDINNFLSGAREHYRIIQQAWNEAKLDTIEEYLSAELLEHIKQQRAELAGEQHTEVMFVDAELVRADQSFGIAELSIKFSGRYRDQVENVEEDITDVWHLQRDTNAENAPWIIVGIEA